MDNVTLIGAITGLMVFVIGIPLYFLPMILARKKRQFLQGPRVARRLQSPI
jgi:hypothetical protein